MNVIKSLNAVRPLSKIIAVILFMILLLAGLYWIGKILNGSVIENEIYYSYNIKSDYETIQNKIDAIVFKIVEEFTNCHCLNEGYPTIEKTTVEENHDLSILRYRFRYRIALGEDVCDSLEIPGVPSPMRNAVTVYVLPDTFFAKVDNTTPYFYITSGQPLGQSCFGTSSIRQYENIIQKSLLDSGAKGYKEQ